MTRYSRKGISFIKISATTSIICVAVLSCSTLRKSGINTYEENVKGLDIELTEVIGGEFLMGGNEEDSTTFIDELPLHNVKLHSYYISTYEITNQQYSIFCKETRRELPQGSKDRSPNSPAIYVSWDDAAEFCRWLSEISNKEYRLPTEAEWEYAARGGIKSKGYKYAGSNDINEVSNYDDAIMLNDDSLNLKIIDQVGQKRPNELGIYDMSGSVWEWCYDGYSDDYYSESPKENPINLDQSLGKVARGGGWLNTPKYHLISNRDHDLYSAADVDLGFRVVLVKGERL